MRARVSRWVGSFLWRMFIAGLVAIALAISLVPGRSWADVAPAATQPDAIPAAAPAPDAFQPPPRGARGRCYPRPLGAAPCCAGRRQWGLPAFAPSRKY